MKCHLSPYRRDIGLLILRLLAGAVFVSAGVLKLQGGEQMWNMVGDSMGLVGVHFAPEFWGFMAMFAELVGGAALLAGIFVLPAGLLLAFTMIIAGVSTNVDPDATKAAGATVFKALSWNPVTFAGQIGLPVPMGVIALALALTGPGKISLKRLLKGKNGCCSGQTACK